MMPRSDEHETKTDLSPRICLQYAEDKTKTDISNYSFLQYADDRKNFYSENEIKIVEKARFQKEDVRQPGNYFHKHIIK